MLKNLLDIQNLDKSTIEKIVETAAKFKSAKLSVDMQDKAVCLMFCENSTRTKMSFELAAKNLGMKTLNFEC